MGRTRMVVPEPDAVPEPLPAALVPPPIAYSDLAKEVYHVVPVFSIPLHPRRMHDFVDEKLPELSEGLDGWGKVDLFCDWVGDFLPRGLRPRVGFIAVPVKRYVVWQTVGVILADNRTEEDREKAKDEERIQKVQEALGVTTRPGWHIWLPM